MPAIIYGDQFKQIDVSYLNRTDFQYKYPNNFDLKPGSELHSSLVNLVMEKAYAASSIISQRYSAWNDLDHSLTGYIPTDEAEKIVKANDTRKPISIVYPYSFAILETLLSYMMAAFFRDPIFRYEGYSPDDVMGSILLEQTIRLHCIKHKVMLNLHTMFRDSFVYGFGDVAPIWKEEGSFEGNALINLDPYRILPDPNVSADKKQEGEFYGWVDDTNYVNLLDEEIISEDIFNVKYIKLLNTSGTSIYNTDQSGRYTKTGTKNVNSDLYKPVTKINIYIKLIPADYNLSDNTNPEIWFFQVAGDAILIQARPANFKHKKFPIASAVPDFDGYSSSPIGRLEILSGMQGVLDWLFNSHIANVRKAINDTLIYDPSLINSNDLKDPKPGGLIRMRRQAWGQGRVRDAVHQLQINDVTRGNVADAGWIVNSMQTLMGTDDASMGSLRQGGPERLTKAEYQGTASGAVNRLERIARIVGMQAMQDIGTFFAEHTKQVMSKDIFIKINGSWVDILQQEFADSISRGRMKVSPKDLDINYDVLVRDGSIPGGNYSEVWNQLFRTLGENPQLAQRFDMVKIFKHIARNAGAKNVNDFVRRTPMSSEIQSDSQVQNQVQQGNLIPINNLGSIK